MKNQVEEIKINRNNTVIPIIIPTKNDQSKIGQTDDLNINHTVANVDNPEQIGCGNGTGIFQILIIPDIDSEEFINDDQQQRSIGSFFNSIIMDDFAPELGLF